jgi:hypothetical protein
LKNPIILNHYQRTGEWILTDGVSIGNMSGLVTEYFYPNPAERTIKNHIDIVAPVMIDVLSGNPNTRHNVLVVGYDSGNIIILDPATGQQRTIDGSFYNQANYRFPLQCK